MSLKFTTHYAYRNAVLNLIEAMINGFTLPGSTLSFVELISATCITSSFVVTIVFDLFLFMGVCELCFVSFLWAQCNDPCMG